MKGELETRENEPDCEVYYAVNDSPVFLFMARRSALGVRKFNPTVPISFVIFGEPDAELCETFHTCRIDLVVRPAVLPYQVYYLKLLALEHVSRTRRLLFADADTEVFGDVQAIFDAYRDADIYAREEHMVREGIPGCQIDHVVLANARAYYGVAPVPIFNTGVMVMNHQLQTRITAVLSDYEDIRERFLSGEVPYPCVNGHVVEEIATTIMLGRIAGLTTGFIDRAVSPWYPELQRGDVASPGVILHTFTEFYEYALSEFGDVASIAAFRAVRNNNKARRPPGWLRRDG